MKATVIVKLKEDVPDPVGREVTSRLRSEGYGEIEDVRFGKYIEVSLSSGDRENAEQRIESICKNLFANSNIEEFEILGIE